jgi:hypothetical protein
MTNSHRFLRSSILLSALACASPVFAQSDAKVGLAMGTPTALSIIWHVSDRLALRPEFNFSSSNTENDFSGTTFDSSTVTPGVSALFYLSTWDNVRAYVSPRYTFSHLSARSSSGSSQTSDGHALAGSIGAQFTPHRRFGVYGEIGLGYAASDSGDASQSSVGLRHAVGAILYF